MLSLISLKEYADIIINKYKYKKEEKNLLSLYNILLDLINIYHSTEIDQFCIDQPESL
jgi:hypothetical protein